MVLVSLRGDQEVNEVKLQNQLMQLATQFGAKTVLSLTVPDATAQAQWASQPLPLGYIAPDLPDSSLKKLPGLAPKFLRLVDKTAAQLQNFITGANESGHHLVGANWDTDFPLPKSVLDLRKARPGDRAIHDPTQTLKSARGIEIGISSSWAPSIPRPWGPPTPVKPEPKFPW